MRFILCFLMSLCITAFSQRQPVGLVIAFNSDVSFIQKQNLVGEIQGLKPLNAEHELKGFDVTLVEGDVLLDEDRYEELRKTLEASSLVEFTSVFYRTDHGGFGGDLQELYVKPKSHVEPQMWMEKFNLKALAPHYFMPGVWVFKVDKNSTPIREIQRQLLTDGSVDYASVNTLHSVLATVSDPYFENQWALENTGSPLHFDGTAGADMEVVNAWDISTGDPSIKVAVLDSGSDTNHVDLEANLLPGFDATGGGSLGYPNTTYANDGHGTCTAGIIGAVGDNGEGIAGVAYDCKIIPVKIFYYILFAGDVIPFTSSEAGTDGIIWAVNTAKADILSNSWGLRASDIVLLGIDTVFSNAVIAENIQVGRDGKGTPMLFSSGNEGDDFSIWPAAHPRTISVGASTMCDEIKTPTDCSPEGWWGSNYGANLDVTAPGVKVLSTDMTDDLGYNGFADNNYSMFNGTSAACPNAAGVMALILSVNPDLTANDARAILSITAEKNGGYAYDTPNVYGAWSEEMGYGRVNAYEAAYYASNFSALKELQDTPELGRIAYVNGQTQVYLNPAPNTQVVVYNLLGAELVRFDMVDEATTLVLNNFVVASGLYLVKISRGQTETTLKAVVQK